MGKTVFIAEKPSVARQFADALKLNTTSHKGYLESENTIITWCVGHLVSMSYPESYDIKYKKWSLSTIPFLPEEFKYEVIPSASEQYKVVSAILNREDVDTIYVCTDSGREGEYIYRLVEKQAGVTGKTRKRVWIDSQTDEEIRRGIKEAKDLSEYDSLADAAYLRAKEDYLMGINFSRALTLKFGNHISSFLNMNYAVVSVGRVMTCVLGMVVNREREIRDFVKTPFYKINAECNNQIMAEWKLSDSSRFLGSPYLYKENGFVNKETADNFISELNSKIDEGAIIDSVDKKKETKNPPLLYNLAELQNDCSKYFKISPDETLRIIQELYERKLTTYPRTDARVLSTAVSKEIYKNISGLRNYPVVSQIANDILGRKSYEGLAKTRYVNDKQITDHYAIIPTGQGIGSLNSLPQLSVKVYELICRRFLSIFYPPAVYQKVSLKLNIQSEQFSAGFKVLTDDGYLAISKPSYFKDRTDSTSRDKTGSNGLSDDGNVEEAAEDSEDIKVDKEFLDKLSSIKKGEQININCFSIKEGETSPPKRYNSGSIILAMENAGQLIEDEELRSRIKGSGIGTSATRAEILKKLVNNKYLVLNKKTQIITPALLGEIIYDVVNSSIRPLLDPKLTASWEKGLTQVADGEITSKEYMTKLNNYVDRRTCAVKGINVNGTALRQVFIKDASYYKAATPTGTKESKSQKAKSGEN